MNGARWEAQRRERLSVEIGALAVTLQGPARARASFIQDYRANGYRDRVRNVRLLTDVGGKWRIVAS